MQKSKRQERHTFDGLPEVVLYPGEDGFWVAECPSLPGCISQGETKEQAVANVKEAIELYLEEFAEGAQPSTGIRRLHELDVSERRRGAGHNIMSRAFLMER